MTILPANATDLERAVDACAEALLAHDPVIDRLWSPALTPAACLPALAWALSVDEWDKGWSEDRKREVIAASIAIHRIKGTRASVIRALAVLGYRGAQLIEREGAATYDGSLPRDGSRSRIAAYHWAQYRVVLPAPITLDQAAQVRAIVGAVAPAHTQMRALDFSTATHRYDGQLARNGTYSRGIA